MIKINIEEEMETREDFIYVLEEIIKQINNGNTSGINPSWDFEGKEDE